MQLANVCIQLSEQSRRDASARPQRTRMENGVGRDGVGGPGHDPYAFSIFAAVKEVLMRTFHGRFPNRAYMICSLAVKLQ